MNAGRACTHLTAEERDAIGIAVRGAACHDTTVQAMLVARLLDGNATDASALRKAVALRDWAAVQRSLHRIKGSAALARCNTLVAAGKSLESAAGQGNAAVVNTLFPRYTAILKEFNDTLLALRPAHGGAGEHGPDASHSTNLK
ncbi:Hpt domain-containing protein [Ralstonia sp. 25mfcol4.1]|uniref:Hpt domain-containing protein n=1 Tax=Burkholderiaceae TaxID=119060 RepID=UPI00088DE49E|nr:Hpt domain-containing protein [Ralstonia sp. 25mfcol4.1]SDP76611.1 Hpt domain-containing protein [Ralstonia sp. 25mfcol4.1]